MLFCFQAHVQKLAEGVKEHEDYNGELQEVEKWLLQMSSRLVTSDSMQSGNLEMATQQLARHKVCFVLFWFFLFFNYTVIDYILADTFCAQILVMTLSIGLMSIIYCTAIGSHALK